MRVSLSETEWTGTVLLYFYRFSFCPQLPSNNTRQKNRLGCFWSRFSSQEECRRRKCYHEKMEAIRPSTSESEQKSIEENICFVFCLTCDFYRFCRLYVLQEQMKKRVKVRLNRRQFRWIFFDRLKSKTKKKKKDLKKCGSNWVKATLDKIP